jgi:hypothetical protein
MKFLRIIYWISIFLICFWISVSIIGPFLPIECVNEELENNYYIIHFWGLPVAILTTLTGTIKLDDTLGSIVGKVCLTIFSSVFSMIFMTLLFFTNMCSWTNGRVIFENKEVSSIKIIEREYGCGATDSGEPVYKIFKVQEVTKYFIKVTEIDTVTIDRAEWMRVEKD